MSPVEPPPAAETPPFPARVDALQRNLDDETLLCYPGPNTHYLAGFYGEPLDRHLLVFVSPTGDPQVVAPEKCRHLVADSWLDCADATPDNDSGAVTRVTADLVETDTVLVDDRTPFGVTGELDAATDADVESAASLLSAHRLRKDESEVAALRRSADVADTVSRDVRAMGADAVGLTEAELAAEIRGQLHAAGATRLSFDVVVASGPHGADPYRRSSDRTIRAGEPVILDFGGFVDGYASDQTRTVVFDGDPPEGFEAAHSAVRAAFEAGVEAVEPGVTAGAVDRATEAVLRERGFGENLVPDQKDTENRQPDCVVVDSVVRLRPDEGDEEDSSDEHERDDSWVERGQAGRGGRAGTHRQYRRFTGISLLRERERGAEKRSHSVGTDGRTGAYSRSYPTGSIPCSATYSSTRSSVNSLRWRTRSAATSPRSRPIPTMARVSSVS